MGALPCAVIGDGTPTVVAAGLWPQTGVDSRSLVQGAVTALKAVTGRRFLVLNRRRGLPSDLTMSQLAGEYADAIRAGLGGPVDVVGTSTGGSIVQQLAADHPDVVRRLVLISTASRLEGHGKALQARVAQLLEAGDVRAAMAMSATGLAPAGGKVLASVLGRTMGPRLLRDPQDVADLIATLRAEDGFDLAHCRGAITAPTLIVGGGRDRFYSVQQFEQTARLIPDAQVRIFPRRGHLSVSSSPRAQATIRGFLEYSQTRDP